MQVKFQHQIEDNGGGALNLVNFKSRILGYIRDHKLSTMKISPVSMFVFWLSFSIILSIVILI